MRLHNQTDFNIDWYASGREKPPRVLSELLAQAHIAFNGASPWDIQVLDDRVYRMILARGSLGFGIAYMEGLWDSAQMDVLFYRLLSRDIDAKINSLNKLWMLGEYLRYTLINRQSRSRAFQVGEHHYDIGNDVFEAMLDPTMSYSCGYWDKAADLAEAQIDKLDLICRKLDLQRGERLLDIGCGWGGLASHAAEKYGVEVLGITVSREQQKLARIRCAGLPVTIELMDYRDLKGQFDKVVSVGMFEHVGTRNYPIYFEVVRRILKKDGLFLLHTIGNHFTSARSDPWMDKFIFPNGKLPSVKEIGAAVEHRFVIEDWHNFGPDYDRTLMAWWANFDAAWPKLKEKYDWRFYRMWKYYLMSCAGFFRSHQGQLWQIVMSPRQRAQRYRSIR